MSSEHTGSHVVVHGHGEPALPERFENPGLPPHRDRLADHDPSADRRSEMQVVALFALSVLGTIGFLLAYFLVPGDGTVEGTRTSNILLGTGLFLAMFGIGVAAVHWAKTLMSDHERSEPRHPTRTGPQDRIAAVDSLKQGAQDSGIGRRGVLKGAVVSAVALAPLSIAVPIIGEVGGDWDVSKFRRTLWAPGKRLTRDPTGEPIRAADVTIGSVYHVVPPELADGAGTPHFIEEKAKAVVIMVRMDPRELSLQPGKEDWAYQGIVAYSKICTHVGCPVALYEQQTHHVLCPCHQSTFDLANGAEVVFGPASRPLPQLPISIDDEGYLIATSDFNEPIGPSYWERLREDD